jgi:hypothetical protein
VYEQPSPLLSSPPASSDLKLALMGSWLSSRSSQEIKRERERENADSSQEFVFNHLLKFYE